MLRNKNRANQSEIPEENRDPEMSDSESNEAAVEEPKASKRSAEKAKATPAKKAKSSKAGPSTEKNAEGEEMFDLGGKKYVNVRSFKGKTYVDIREYYEKDGKLLPGKKGVALNPEQYEALKGLLDTIDEQVASA
ncbi:PC4 domain-containing protein [Aphelenchoides fujianensis]|nr:PC4 domain-containing protein [Aphelenchoides fujianensis]